MARKKTNILAEMCPHPRRAPVDDAHAARRVAAGDAVRGAKLHDEIMHNQRIKEYPQGFVEVLTASKPIFREPGYEQAGKWASEPRQRPQSPSVGEADQSAFSAACEARNAENIQRAVRRAKQNLRDLALCNDMRYFVTLTLDKAKIDRFDMREITRKLNAWCSNMVQREGLAYILVPERHTPKEGETVGAVHFHGFFNGAVEVVDSGTISRPGDSKPRKPRSKAQREQWLAEGGHIVYNLPDWPLGFTTAIELYGDPVAAVNYCCKYIGKQQGGDSLPEKIGGRWFYHGGCRSKPKVSYNDVDFDAMAVLDGAFAWEVPAAGAIFIREKVSL